VLAVAQFRIQEAVMPAIKAKKGTKKSAGMKKGKSLQSVKPLTKITSPTEAVTFEYGGLQVHYTPQKPD
jgi:HD superfamily phosphodiesterase